MAANLTMVRIATKLDDLFNEKIDKSLPELVNPLCQKYWELTFSAMEEKYPDAYPAHIFKNIGRLREIKEQICLRDSKSQEE